MSPLEWVAVGAIGGASALARFFVDGIVASRVPSDFPAGTLAVNASGAFLLGLLTGLALNGESLLLAGTASIGSYTTFSTWMLESQRLTESGDQVNAGANLIVSLGAGLAAAALGRLIGSHL
ncbi:MAG TPA: fluoride efflux transporter CrcB [Solirubrobacteraceae bacterium]|nr:fluoride efflux transporter CrcB [Solirubrobacteraceae bacterium]